MRQKCLSDAMCKLFCDFWIYVHLLTVCVHSSVYKFHSHHLIDVHLYECFTCLDVNKNV